MAVKLNTNIDFGYDDCTDEGINLIALKMDADNSFSFDGSQSLPSSCSSTTGSFSSASSLYDPFTPNSRTSTPQQIINFDAPFDGESMMFDMTPPPSATSNCFPLDFKATVAPNMVDHHGMPSTPLRCNNIFDTTISHGSLDFTPTQSIDLYNYSDGLGSSPFLVSSPSQQFSGSTSSYDLASIWGQHADGSPITFSSPGMHLATPPDSSPFHSHHGHDRRRVVMDGPQMRTAMLQQHTMDQLVGEQHTLDPMMDDDIEHAQVQAQSVFDRVHQASTKSRASKPRPAARKSAGVGPGNYRVSKNAGLDIPRVKKGKFKCDVPNCTKTYTRAEHLKRHKDGAAHKDNPQLWTCEFCPKTKPFDRADNYRDHLVRHCDDRPGRRTNFHPGAAILLIKLQSEMKTKTKKARSSQGDITAIPSLLKSVKSENIKVEVTKTDALFS